MGCLLRYNGSHLINNFRNYRASKTVAFCPRNGYCKPYGVGLGCPFRPPSGTGLTQ